MTINEIRAAIRDELAALEQTRARLLGALDALEPKAASAEEPAKTIGPIGKSAVKRKLAPRGANIKKILDYVAEHPGARAAEIAAATEIKGTVVMATTHTLAKQGTLHKLELGGRAVAYELPQRPNGRAQTLRLNVQTLATPERELKDRRVAYVTQEG